MPSSDSYEPVACGFYNELGLRMMRGRPCTLIVDAGEQTEAAEAIIADISTEGDAEYVRLDDESAVYVAKPDGSARKRRRKSRGGAFGLAVDLALDRSPDEIRLRWSPRE